MADKMTLEEFLRNYRIDETATDGNWVVQKKTFRSTEDGLRHTQFTRLTLKDFAHAVAAFVVREIEPIISGHYGGQENLVTRDMAMDAGYPEMEGQHHSYIPCPNDCPACQFEFIKQALGVPVEE